MQKLAFAVLAALLAVGLAFAAWEYNGVQLENSQVLVFTTGTTPSGPSVEDAALEGDTSEGKVGDLSGLDPSTGLIYPLQGTPKPLVPQGLFGAPRDNGRTHLGVDFPKAKGTPVIAPANGKVIKLESDCAEASQCRCGNAVRLKSEVNGQTYEFRMCHLDAIAVHLGDDVQQGQTIGTVGNTGNARTTSPHLHFEVKRNGQLVDPLVVYRANVAPDIGPPPQNDVELLAKARAAPDHCIPLQDLGAIVRYCSDKYVVNPNLIFADMMKESGCGGLKVNPLAGTRRGARGLMQMFPAAVVDVNKERPESEKVSWQSEDFLKPSVNICAGVHYMRIICMRYGVCNTDGMLKSYYCGAGGYLSGACNGDAVFQAYVPGIRQNYASLTSDQWPSTAAVPAIDNPYAIGNFQPAAQTASGASVTGLCKAGALGDSITAAQPSYADKLDSLCGQDLFTAHGVVGEGSQKILERVDGDILANKYRDVIILAGINDVGLPAEQTERNLAAIYHTAKLAGMRVVALTITPCKGYSTCNAEMQIRINSINAWILAKPADIDFVVNAYAALDDGNGAIRAEYSSPDKLHPNAAGQEKIGEEIFRVVYASAEACKQQLKCTGG